jgi:hypothetical protein
MRGRMQYAPTGENEGIYNMPLQIIVTQDYFKTMPLGLTKL